MPCASLAAGTAGKRYRRTEIGAPDRSLSLRHSCGASDGFPSSDHFPRQRSYETCARFLQEFPFPFHPSSVSIHPSSVPRRENPTDSGLADQIVTMIIGQDARRNDANDRYRRIGRGSRVRVGAFFLRASRIGDSTGRQRMTIMFLARDATRFLSDFAFPRKSDLEPGRSDTLHRAITCSRVVSCDCPGNLSSPPSPSRPLSPCCSILLILVKNVARRAEFRENFLNTLRKKLFSLVRPVLCGYLSLTSREKERAYRAISSRRRRAAIMAAPLKIDFIKAILPSDRCRGEREGQEPKPKGNGASLPLADPLRMIITRRRLNFVLPPLRYARFRPRCCWRKGFSGATHSFALFVTCLPLVLPLPHRPLLSLCLPILRLHVPRRIVGTIRSFSTFAHAHPPQLIGVPINAAFRRPC